MPFVDHSQFGDHPYYDDLYKYAEIASISAPENTFAVEVGTRSGGSALTILDAIRESSKKLWLITIDPYGNKPYFTDNYPAMGIYTDNYYRESMKLLSDYCAKYELNWAHYKMKSQDWIKYWPSIEFWADEKILEPKIYFLHLDGDHKTNLVKDDLNSFWPYIIEGGVVCIDDANYVDIDEVCEGFNYVRENDRVLITKYKKESTISHSIIQKDNNMQKSEEMSAYMNNSLWPVEKRKLVELANSSKGEFIIEVGVLKGETTKYLAENTDKRIIAIDPYEMIDNDNKLAKDMFYENCREYLNSGRIIHIERMSYEAHVNLTPYIVKNCALVFIDWDANGEQHLRDFIDYGNYVAPDGYLVAHDFFDMGTVGKHNHISYAIAEYMKYIDKELIWNSMLYYPKHSHMSETMHYYGGSPDFFYINRSRGLVWCSPNS